MDTDTIMYPFGGVNVNKSGFSLKRTSKQQSTTQAQLRQCNFELIAAYVPNTARSGNILLLSDHT